MRLPTSLRLISGIAAAALALTGCGFNGLYGKSLPGGTNLGNHPYTVTIEFRNVLDLVPESNVKVNDVAVGKVTKVTLDTSPSLGSLKGWIAEVTIKVRGNVVLPENARAAIRMTSLLGEKYVDLEQPVDQAASTNLHNGSNIPLIRTDTAPEVEEVLGALADLLTGGGLQQIQTISRELNNALRGNEGAIRDLLTQLNTFVGGLDSQKDKITTALDKINALAATLNANKAVLAQAIDTFPQALKILSDDRAQFTHLLVSLTHLGEVATGILTCVPAGAAGACGSSSPGSSNSVQNELVYDLQQLEPTLKALSDAGTSLPKSFKLLLTYPFPVGKTLDFVRGDYANLNAFLDFNLNENLCGISAIFCGLNLNSTSKSAKSSTSTPSTTQSGQSGAAQQLPAIPGLGG
jgi:phospholipid/cholesterol/gamma-HCH transport system substrate-binding protein